MTRKIRFLAGAGAATLAASVLMTPGASAAGRPSTSFAEIFAAGPREILRSGGELANIAAAAYLGQAAAIEDKNILASALAIHSVEGRHAAALNTLSCSSRGSVPSRVTKMRPAPSISAASSSSTGTPSK